MAVSSVPARQHTTTKSVHGNATKTCCRVSCSSLQGMYMHVIMHYYKANAGSAAPLSHHTLFSPVAVSPIVAAMPMAKSSRKRTHCG